MKRGAGPGKIAQMFGTTQGFVASAESVSEPEPVTETVEDDDF